MKKNKWFKKIVKIFRNKEFLFVFAIFVLGFILRTYDMDGKYPFGFDQVVSAWAAKNTIVNHWFPLVGMVAKGNSGIFIGPLYYYFVVIFYYLFNLNPIAYQAIALVSGAISFVILYFVSRELFNPKVAIIALVINTFGFSPLLFDHTQWPVQLLPAASLLIFYFLYKVVTGDVKKLIYLAITIGIAFNLHFTAIFFPLIFVLALPIIPWKKKTIKYLLISVPFFVIWLVPNIIYSIVDKNVNSDTSSYASTYYHGFHLRRMFQLVSDAFIQFESYLIFDNFLKSIKYLLIPLFFFFYLLKSFTSEKVKLCYLIILWFLVPWLVFTTYSGEITDYYFVVNKFIALLVIAYLLFLVWNLKYVVAKIVIIAFLIYYSFLGVTRYIPYKSFSLQGKELVVRDAISKGQRIEFQVGAPESYIYYYLMQKKGIEVY